MRIEWVALMGDEMGRKGYPGLGEGHGEEKEVSRVGIWGARGIPGSCGLEGRAGGEGMRVGHEV